MKNLLIGVLAAIILTISGYFAWQYYLQQHSVTVVFDNARGLQTHAKVWMNGVMIGEVRNVSLSPNGVDIEIYIHQQHWSGLTDNSLFVIDPSPNDNHAVIRVKKSEQEGKPIQPQQRIQGVNSLIMWNMSEFSGRMQQFINSQSIKELVNNLKRFHQELDDTIKDMDWNSVDEQIRNDIQQLSQEIDQAINSGQLQQRLDEFIERIENLKISLNKISNGEEVKKLVKSLERLAQQIQQQLPNQKDRLGTELKP